jgi:hypothetical protein
MRVAGLLAVGLLALAAPWSSHLVPAAGATARSHATCGIDSYVNVRGNCVHRPVHADRAPSGATAKCRDGTYSFSQSRRGTCSWHGGVATWL